MNTETKLKDKYRQLLAEIEKSARDGNAQHVLRKGEQLREVEHLIAKQEAIKRALDYLDMEHENGHHQTKKEIENRQDFQKEEKLPGRGDQKKGKVIREEFLEKLRGQEIHLSPHSGRTIHKTRSGAKVGIAVANAGKNPDRWWLGLGYGSFDRVVLLCKPHTGHTIAICIPEDFFQEHLSNMSMGKAGTQINFNVVRMGSDYVLTIKRKKVRVSQYVDNYKPLR